jgi:glycine/D-amino acid oxidase-like deaminating enzyme
MRAVTHDRNPLVGKVLDNSNDLNKKPHSLNQLSYYPNLFINIGYGSRGYTLAPFISKSLASMIDSTESSEDEFFLNYLNPYRSWFKKIGLRKQLLLNTI